MDDKVEYSDLDLELDESSPPGMDDAKSHPGFSYTSWVVQHNSEVELFVIWSYYFLDQYRLEQPRSESSQLRVQEHTDHTIL